MSLQRFLRELDASARRMEAARARQERVRARGLRLQAKENDLMGARAAVEEFDDRIQQLTCIHHEVGDSVDWHAILGRPPPKEPKPCSKLESQAIQQQQAFKASLLQKILGKEKMIREELETRVRFARRRDAEANEKAMEDYRSKLEEWTRLQAHAEAVIRGDLEAYRSAMEALEPFAEILEIGCDLFVTFQDKRTARVLLRVESEKVVPNSIKALTKTGKLSIKTMPTAKGHELYQDYVCGCALRCGRELFSFLPLYRVIVDVEAALHNKSTGHTELQNVLTVCLTKKKLEGLNLKNADPSDAVGLFQHRMGFKRSLGFSPVEPLALGELTDTA